MPYPNNNAGSDVWSLRDNYKGVAGGIWPSDAIEYANAVFNSQVASAQSAVNTFSVSAGTVYGVKIWGAGGGGGKSYFTNTFTNGGDGGYVEGFVLVQGNQMRLTGGSRGRDAQTGTGAVAGATGNILGGAGGDGEGNTGGGGGGGGGASVLEWSNDGANWTKVAVLGGGGGGGGNDQGQDHSLSGSNATSGSGGAGGYWFSGSYGLLSGALYASGGNGIEGGQNSTYPNAQGYGGGGGTANAHGSGGVGGGNSGTDGSANGGGVGGTPDTGNAGGGGGGGGGYFNGGGASGSEGSKFSQAGGGGAGSSYLDGNVFVYLKSSSSSDGLTYGSGGVGPTDNSAGTSSSNGRVELWEVSN